MKYTPVGVDIAKHLIQVHFINEYTDEVVDKQGAEYMGSPALKAAQRKKAEADRQKAETEKKLKQAKEQEAKAKADAAAKAREELFVKAGIKPAPEYTPEMVKAAEAALGSAGVMALNWTPGAMQLSVAGGGVWTATGEVLSSLGAAISRGIAALGATATAGTVGPMVAAASTILFSAPAGGGSDKVPGRDLEGLCRIKALLGNMLFSL